MSWPLVQFVDAPTATANVRHDFNDLEGFQTFVPRNGFSFGVPALEGEPDAIDNEFGLRQGLQFQVYLMGYKSDALAVKAAMTRELMRRRNWLKVQMSPNTAPVFIPTYRTMPEATDVTFVDSIDDSNDVWSVVVRLNAKPWAQGLTETITTTIVATTGAGTNRQQVALPAIKGDVATPVNLSVTTLTSGPWLAALSPQSVSTLNRWTGVTVQASGSTTLASAPAAIVPGRYRVIAFMPTSTSVALEFGWAPDANGANAVLSTPAGNLPYQMHDDVAYTTTVTAQDLGEVQFTGAPGSMATFIPKILLRKVSGGGTTTATLMLLTLSDEAIDDDATLMAVSASTSAGALWLGDDGNDAVVFTDGGQTFSSPVLPKGATALVAHPQHENVLTFLAGTTPFGGNIDVTITYAPLRLDLPSG